MSPLTWLLQPLPVSPWRFVCINRDVRTQEWSSHQWQWHFLWKLFCLISAMIVEAACRRLSGIWRCFLERKATNTPALPARDSWGKWRKLAWGLLIADKKRANHFHISHKTQKIWKPGEGLQHWQSERTFLLALTTMGCPSAPQELQSRLKTSASVQKRVAFSQRSLSSLQHLGMCSSGPALLTQIFGRPWLMPMQSLLLRGHTKHNLRTMPLTLFSSKAPLLLPGESWFSFSGKRKDYRCLLNLLCYFCRE